MKWFILLQECGYVDLCHLFYNVNVKHDVPDNEKWSEHIQL